MRAVKHVTAATAAVVALLTPTPAGARTGGCHDAVNLLWPAQLRGNPRAQNRRSSAAGCFQLLRLHSPRFARLGFSWSDRYDPVVNSWVALDLYRQAGWTPWR